MCVFCLPAVHVLFCMILLHCSHSLFGFATPLYGERLVRIGGTRYGWPNRQVSRLWVMEEAFCLATPSNWLNVMQRELFSIDQCLAGDERTAARRRGSSSRLIKARYYRFMYRCTQHNTRLTADMCGRYALASGVSRNASSSVPKP